MTTTTAALFDVDGTLLDTTYFHALAWWEALRQYDRTVPAARVHRAIGMGADQLFDHLLGRDRDRDDDEAIAAAHDALYAAYWPVIAPLPGAADLLRACAARGRRIVLASSASERELTALRRVLDADDVIDAATTADDVSATKPAPDLVRAALDRADTAPADSVFVGDTVWDVVAAGRAGVPCVAVESGGFSAQELLAAGAAEVHRDTAGVLADLDRSLLAQRPAA
ncbi:HAD superfamily hydrolase (TIGR01509 family)/HAD superfamily hydrolase (TIGR01549 family) [Streptomyces sp. 1114.5]|uniref:HAD family hydrolase n=1 Tax=unclassified Streptomyces TaxID=2593676 RepID=UPI000BC5A207|nr:MULTISPECIES: HAD family hydrolase [unclassified Streptomyces]RKT09478.1 HAD superfamily hydrolase (TIGR01509 family)/HAD superfamily hydrolase (TIGR01549 family) [Streptomyces sp. 1114.5]SOB88518.1 haloacid dehalogenase superfamily, subfamily IA, variant 3 with third motif having DD or ED/haloacid dehalogenase superfamily, subfamily IA, variant 1 with third motif having Dx(3-4)D or Dx(3-4)E [Streptomyces sp. 1331.2]